MAVDIAGVLSTINRGLSTSHMRIDILTLFPEYFAGPFDVSILKRAREAGVVELRLHDIREWAEGKHNVVDDYPYGGGAGMVMKPEPLAASIEAVATMAGPAPRVLLTPQGRRFTQTVAEEFAALPRLILVCGHYEGVDERVREHLIDDEISLGDFVLSGGEPAAVAVVDAVLRLVPGVVGSAASLEAESFSEGLLEYPQYTRPPDFRGWTVPEILLSGNHAKIATWRRQQRILRTARRRPDLLERVALTAAERAWLTAQMGSADDWQQKE
jgi:tRNA (guanine37-N1)-methyltransferase